MKPSTINQRLLGRLIRPMVFGAALSIFAVGMQGCNDAQAGALLGAGVGALAGQAMGDDTESTLIGAGAGAVGGYIVGNEIEKSRPRRHYPEY